MTSRGAAVLVPLLMAFVLFTWPLGLAPFDDPGEGMHAEIAHEVLVSGDWITLHLNGVRYFDKPPLLYWLASLAARTFGEREWSARLAPLVGTLGAVAATGYFGARLLSPMAGVVAGVALLTCPGFVPYAVYLRPETLFLASLQWVLTLLLVPCGSRRLNGALSGLALGAAAMAKDPLGPLGPLGAVAIARWLAPRRRERGMIVVTALVLIAVAGIWYAAVELANRGFLWYTFVDNHALNAARARHFPDEDVPLGSAEFLAVASVGALPWIIPAVAVSVMLLRRRAWRDADETPWVALAIWSGALLTIFTISPFKLPHYGLPAYPAIALLAARWWTTTERPRAMVLLHVVIFAGVALAMFAIVATGGHGLLDRVVDATDVYARKEAAIGQTPPFPSWAALRPLVIGSMVAFGSGALALSLALAAGRWQVAMAVTMITMLVWTPMISRAMNVVAASRSVRELAREVATRGAPGDILAHEGPIENSGALELYSGRRPVLVDGRTSVLGFGATFPDAADTFWSRPRLITAWRGSSRVFLVTIRQPRNSVIAELAPSEVFALAAGNGRWLYSNRP
jgi:4-amino-4-deoxy-L-arabinose transferase-like glycosyltransferase